MKSHKYSTKTCHQLRIVSLKKYTGKKFLAVTEGTNAKSLELLLAKIRAQLTYRLEKRSLVASFSHLSGMTGDLQI